MAEIPGPQTALVISSWPTDREFIVWLLGQRLFTCREVGTVRAAILALDRDCFDLIILDYHLIENDDDFRRLREAAPTTAIVLIAESTAADAIRRVLDDHTVFVQRGQMTYHLLEKVPGYRLEDRVLRIVEARLLHWARPVFSGDPSLVDLQLLSEIVATALRRRRLIRKWMDELWLKARPMMTMFLISIGVYFLQQWVGIINWRVILKGLGIDVGS